MEDEFIFAKSITRDIRSVQKRINSLKNGGTWVKGGKNEKCEYCSYIQASSSISQYKKK